MIYHEDNIYETIGHVSNLQNDCCSDQFTERSVSTSDISQSSSENYHSNRMTGTNKTKNIQTQMNFTIHTVREGATVRAGDEINVYFPNDLKCKKTLTMAVLVGILLCSILILTKILFSSTAPNPFRNYSNEYTTPDYEGVEVINRNGWNADEIRKESYCLTKDPAKHIMITQTGTEFCSAGKCKSLVKKLQDYHLYTHELKDIAYNFLIDSDGTIYEGLGWRQKCIDEDFDGICFAFIGTFHKNSPKNDTIVKLKTMIDCGARKNLLESNFTMYIHRRLMSQGNNKLYDVIPNDQNFKQHFKMHNSNRRR